jgi:hypothetical protein
MSDSAFAVPSVGGSIGTHESTYIHDRVRLFDASVLLDLSLPAPASGGNVVNVGHASYLKWITSGAWTRETQGNGHIWTNSSASAGIMMQPLLSDTSITSEYNNAGASFYAAGTVVTTSGSNATFGITDTNNDLEQLFEWLSTDYRQRMFKIDISSNSPTSAWFSGYIGEVAKSGNNYTLNIYKNSLGASRNFVGGGTWSTTNVKWKIYHSNFETGSFSSETILRTGGVGMSMWYGPGTTTPLNGMIFGRCASQSGYAFFKSFGIKNGTSTATQLDAFGNGDGTSIAGLIPTTPILRHYALIKGATNYYSMLLINGRIVNSGINNPNVWDSFYGLMGIGMNITTDTPTLPIGSKIAFPRIWESETSGDSIAAAYAYERNILGLSWIDY